MVERNRLDPELTETELSEDDINNMKLIILKISVDSILRNFFYLPDSRVIMELAEKIKELDTHNQ